MRILLHSRKNCLWERLSSRDYQKAIEPIAEITEDVMYKILLHENLIIQCNSVKIRGEKYR